MGANVYLESVASYGTVGTATSTTALTINIPGKSGERIAIRAFGFMAGGTVENLYFMQSLGKTTLAAVVASGGSILNLAGEPGVGTASLAVSDNICLVQDNGVYHFSVVGAKTGLSVITLCTVVTGAGAIGQKVYTLGVYSDSGHIVYPATTVSVVNKEAIEGGIFYGTEKGSPMKVHEASDATGVEEILYLTVDYINK